MPCIRMLYFKLMILRYTEALFILQPDGSEMLCALCALSSPSACLSFYDPVKKGKTKTEEEAPKLESAEKA